jgi:hypothetical protein
MVHYGEQWCGISGIPTSLFACQKILKASRNTKDIVTGYYKNTSKV